MAHRFTSLESPLFTLNEAHPADEQSNRNNGSPPSTATLSPRPRRSGFNRFARRETRTRASSSQSPTAFNPEATEFVPTSRMPSKRKASSLARPGKHAPTNSRDSGSDQGTPENPIISAQEIFGAGALASFNSVGDVLEAGFSALLDEEEESGLFERNMSEVVAEVVTPPNNTITIRRQRLNDAMMVMRAQVSDKPKRTAEPVQSHSAILFSRDGNATTNEALDEIVKLRYLPLCPRFGPGRREAISKDTDLIIMPSHRNRINATIQGLLQCSARWPKDKLPIEIFDLITAFLSRDDVKSMRLVSREFERNVSGNLFASSVVPFNTELYDMIEEDSKAAQRAPRPGVIIQGKGKGRAIEVPGPSADVALRGLHWQNAKDDVEGKVYKGHGLRVFQGFGPHFRRFGMSFEVAEFQLARPPIKKELDYVDSYHGSYDWPHQQYTRFAGLAGLERTADETLRMKAAFSNLDRVQEIGLSLDNGLGWLNGPDRSIYARIFQRGSPVFGQSRAVPDQQMQEARIFWQTIQDCHASIGFQGSQREVSLVRRALTKSPSDISGLHNTRFANTKLWSSITAGRTAPTVSPGCSLDEGQHGVLYTTFGQPDLTAATAYDKSALVPAELRKEQKEWLMETDWAQRAFLECYLLAVMDNPVVFGRVKTLTIAKISSGLLPILSREAFWDALPAVTDVTIYVKPDWRSVERDNAGFAETCQRQPSEAVNTFYRCILRDRLCLRPSITKLNIGWQAGGEHADGIFARNNHVLPAPITQLEHSTAVNDQFGLVFKFVEHLTLHNCWISPVTLQGLVKSHQGMALKTLVLESVSLTAHPRFPAGGQAAMHNQVLQALAALPVVAGQGQHANIPQWLQNMPGLPPGWQQMLQNNAQQAAQAGLPANLAQMAQQGLNPQQAQQEQAVQAPVPVIQLAAANGGIHAQPPPTMLPLHVPGAFAAPVGNAVPPHFAQNLFAALAQPNANVQQSSPTPSHWTEGHRIGSWAEVLNKLSPGPIFSDFLPKPQPWEQQLPKRKKTNLQKIEFKSCGYVKVTNNTTFDQFAIDAGADQNHLSPWFRARQAALLPAMMTTNDHFISRIVQHMPERELNALRYAWGLREGWADRSKADEVEYDGLLAGGTGRFSGKIEKGTSLPTKRV